MSKDGRFFATCSDDQTVRFWNSKTKELFATFFLSGEDWVLWTPQGYYNCSADGERLVGWQINRGPNQFAEFFPAAQFAAKYFRKDVVQKAFDLASAKESVSQLVGRDQITPSSILPPDVSIVSPKNGEPVDKKTVIIEAKARARSNNPISWLELKQDGCTTKDIHGESKRFAKESTDFNAAWEVKLAPGVESTFSVVAFSKSSGTENTSIPIRITSKQVAENDNFLYEDLHIVSIGVSKYKDYKELVFAKQDAQKLATKIEQRAKGLFKNVHTKIVLEDAVDDKSLRQAFDEIRQGQNTKKNLAIVYLAGHGTADADGAYNFLYHNCPQDDPTLISQFGFSASEFEKEVKDLCPVLLLLDTCSAGELTNGFSRDLARKSNLMTFASSNRVEAAIENTSLGMSNFAYAINSALDGRAQLEPYKNKKALFSRPFVRFVRDEVEKLSDDAQHPQMAWGEFNGKNFPLLLIDPSTK